MSLSSPSTLFSPGHTAVITGSASGIGLSLAESCALAGMNVILCDNHASNLSSAKTMLASMASGTGAKIVSVEMDVRKLGDYERVKDVVSDIGGGKISLLALNAGIGDRPTSKTEAWSDAAYFSKIMEVNLFGVINGISVLLPLVTSSSTASNPSAIIITGSKQGITNPPGNPAYNASKSAIRTLAEHLSYDLSSASPTTSVHLLIPGWTFTGLSGNKPFPAEGEGEKEKPEGAWTGEQVVDFLIEKMEEGKFYVVCPDNDVDEEMDKKRILWGTMDLVKGRPPLTRWRGDYAVEAEGWMKNDALKWI